MLTVTKLASLCESHDTHRHSDTQSRLYAYKEAAVPQRKFSLERTGNLTYKLHYYYYHVIGFLNIIRDLAQETLQTGSFWMYD